MTLGCVSSSSNNKVKTAKTESTVRVVFIADTHIIGPQYECCSESDGVDNASIMRTQERLQKTITQINAIEPQPDHIFILGDVLHDAYHSTDLGWYQTENNAFKVAADLLDDLHAPVHILWGNHDYEVDCNLGPNHHDRELSHQLFETFFQMPTHGVVEAGSWKFIMLNSQLGPTWDPNSEKCDTELGSYGEEQLTWLDNLLSDDRPAIVMTHHHMLTSTAEAENDGGNPDLATVLARHDNVAFHIAGHLHRWYDIESSPLTPVRHIILGATRYDDDNFWVAEFDTNGDYRILDYEKPQWNTTCADTWLYYGIPELTANTVENGDCSF